jgi:single-strand DNA-binding protein
MVVKMNKAILTGRIANDLELKQTTTGKSICEFRLATNRPTNRDGERVADFINCRVWNKQAENLVKYQTKGNLIAVIGRMQVDAYQDKDGKNKFYTYLLVEELEYLEKKKEEANEFQDLKTTTEVQEQFEYNDSDLPF